MFTEGNRSACQQRTYYVSKKEIPLSCPTAEMAVWNAHPKVFLPIEKMGQAQCPYCSAIYILKD